MSSSKRLYVDLQSGSSYALANINLHANVHHVIVRKSQPFSSDNAELSVSDELRTFEAIASLLYLDRLDIICDNAATTSRSLPVQGLITILRNVPSLRMLRLESLQVTGRKEDFVPLVQAIQEHSSLAEIHMIGCLPSQETETIQALAQALAGLPTLRTVEIVETRFHPEEAWSGQALATLCRSPSLEVLRIQGPHFLRDSHIQLVAQEMILSSKSQLKELSLLCDIGKEALTAICNLLCVSQTLQVLNLNRIQYGQQAPEIAKALANNTSLRSLHLYFHYGTVRGIRSSFQQLLERNYTLEKVHGGWACSNIDFYLKLNKAGRASLLQESGKATPKEWVDVMAERQDCVSSLFYLLSQNPTLCKVN